MGLPILVGRRKVAMPCDKIVVRTAKWKEELETHRGEE
jgi:hypothetical protein